MSFSFLRTLPVVAVWIVMMPSAFGQTLADIIEQYEAFDRAGDPEASQAVRDVASTYADSIDAQLVLLQLYSIN